MDSQARHRSEQPTDLVHSELLWGSDLPAQVLREIGIEYIALNPGSSYRGFHDSLVNYLGNRNPQILLCLHEEHAVAIAHGYAKVTGKPMAVAVHSNVGLMHASMAVYNAWCDRVPMVILGANGPVDSTRRRPWIDWVHTTLDQGAIVRNFVKWDDQPASPMAAVESLLRANQIATTLPHGPTYVCMDVSYQEAKLAEVPELPDASLYLAPRPPHVDATSLDQISALLAGAASPVLLIGRGSRQDLHWRQRVVLAERLQATVLTDGMAGALFPTAHPLHGPAAALFNNASAVEVLRGADVVLSLDWIDLGSLLHACWPDGKPAAQVIHCSLDQYNHRSWSAEYQRLTPVHCRIAADPDGLVGDLLARIEGAGAGVPASQATTAPVAELPGEGTIRSEHIGLAMARIRREQPLCLIRTPIKGIGPAQYPLADPLDYLGMDGGGGVGSGPGMAVGAALALSGTERLPLAILGDGDFLMGVTALWTATKYDVPLLIVVANNRSFFNDEEHQQKVALIRGRPPANKWIGQRIEGPPVDLSGMARAQGFEARGPIATPGGLPEALVWGIDQVRRGGRALVDVLIDSEAED